MRIALYIVLLLLFHQYLWFRMIYLVMFLMFAFMALEWRKIAPIISDPNGYG